MMYLSSFQDQGTAFTLSEANKQLTAARSRTPVLNHEQFRSSIRFESGLYVWYWVLR